MNFETIMNDVGFVVNSDRTVLAVADGLGHGPEAARAATAAMDSIRDHWKLDCAAIFSLCDERLRRTRGASLAVAIVEHASDLVTVGSIGNVRSVLLQNLKIHRFVNTRGIVGAPYKSLDLQTVPLCAGNTLVMFSDGIDEYLRYMVTLKGLNNRHNGWLRQLLPSMPAAWMMHRFWFTFMAIENRPCTTTSDDDCTCPVKQTTGGTLTWIMTHAIRNI